MQELFVFRYFGNGKQTQSSFLLAENGYPLFGGYMLELPWAHNLPMISCIPEGTYKLVHRVSDSHGKHLMVDDVPGREYILIHSGNFNADTKGCLLPGAGFSDINKDGCLDVLESRITLKWLLNAIGDKTPRLIIKNCFDQASAG